MALRYVSSGVILRTRQERTQLLALAVLLAGSIVRSGISYAASQPDCDVSKPGANPLNRFRIDDVVGSRLLRRRP